MKTKANSLFKFLLISIGLMGCSTKESDLKIIDANIIVKDEIPQLKVCFNRNLEKEESYISDVKVKTKDGCTFGRSDMSLGSNSNNTDGNCIFEMPYFFMRNTRDEVLRGNFKKSMKPSNIKSIHIKLGEIQVNLDYSDKYKLTEYVKNF